MRPKRSALSGGTLFEQVLTRMTWMNRRVKSEIRPGAEHAEAASGGRQVAPSGLVLQKGYEMYEGVV